MSAAYHAAVFGLIWPSTISDLCARSVPVWLVSGAADGIHVQVFQELGKVDERSQRGPKLSKPLLSRARSLSTASRYLPHQCCAGERYRSLEPIRAANGSLRSAGWLQPAQQGGLSCNFSSLYTCTCSYMSQRRMKLTHECRIQIVSHGIIRTLIPRPYEHRYTHTRRRL